MAKDVYYFSHDVNASNDPKIVAMESEFGVISYAWWWKLIEKLASSEDYRLPFKKYTFIALDKELGILNENERPLNENERTFFCSNKSFLFVNSLISDFELLECDDEYLNLKKSRNSVGSQALKVVKLAEKRNKIERSFNELQRPLNKTNKRKGKERKVYIHIHIMRRTKMKNQIMISYPCLMMNPKNMINIKTCLRFI